MEIRIYVANLRAYNAGELKGAWFDLPVDMDDIFSTIFDDNERDENGQPYGDWAIHDIDVPSGLDISEYASIESLNQLVEELGDVDIPEITSVDDAGDVINFASELEERGICDHAMEYVDDIVSDEGLDEMVEHMSYESGWQRVKHFLSGIEWMNDGYYRIDGYGNAENLTVTYLESVRDELVGEVKRFYEI